MNQKRIIFRAPMLSQSGYGTHARQIAAWLLNLQDSNPNVKVEFDVVQWGITPWHVDHTACDGLIGKIIQHCQRTEGGYDLSFQLQLPNEWDPFLATTNIGLTAAVETDRCNPAWVDAVNRMDLVVVPSEFTKRVLENSGEVTTPVTVVPESWLPECRNAERGKSILDGKLELETDFNFLIVAQFTGNNPENDRKNLAYTIKWLMEEFKDEQNVGVIIKTNFGRATSVDKQNCLRTLSQLVMECRQGIGPRVYLLHGHMSNEEIVGLYTHPKVRALVSLTRGEGFGLPILEAATCGLPVIATDWSAHTEFLNKGKFVKVARSLHKIHPSRVDNQIFMENAQWANPEEQDARRKLSRFHSSPTIPTEWATDLASKLKESHSPEAIEQHYNELLVEHNLLEDESEAAE